MPSGSYIVKTDSNMPESYFEKAKFSMYFNLKILTGKKHPKIELQHLRKIRIWTFGSLKLTFFKRF